jgi:copper homeostasis protein
LMDLQVDRLLTSGQAATALEGASLIRKLVQRTGDHLTVMAGAGIQPQQIARLVQSTGVREIHASASVMNHKPVDTTPGIVHPTRATREDIVREMVKAIRGIA